MRKTYLILSLLLSLSINVCAQQEKEAESNDPGSNGFMHFSEEHVDWSKPESFLKALVFYDYYDPTLFPPEFEDKVCYVFSFSDSLTIQTYDRINKQLIQPKSFKIDDSGIIHLSESDGIDIELFSIYGDHWEYTARYIKLD